MDDIQNLLSDLIKFQSITPWDAGCQEYISNYLIPLGFECHNMDNNPVSNLFATLGKGAPMLIFAGHTDVVPVGDLKEWKTDPFELHQDQDMLFGRGVADMKGSLASMLHMAKRFVQQYPSFQGTLGFLITSGEEGDDFHLGTPYVMEQLKIKGLHLDYCIVGEPSSTKQVGDVIKIGRRGSLSAKIRLQGIQGHVAYPHLAENPIHAISPVLKDLTSIQWDAGNDFFPPTSLQVTHIHSGGHGGNIIPGSLEMDMNFRYSTEQTATSLKKKVSDCFAQYDLKPEIIWRLNGEPFLTSHGKLLESTQKSILKHTGMPTELSTTGGTSDGRFIAPYGVEVVELGPINATIHQHNESVSFDDLKTLEAIYFSICEDILGAV